MSPINCILSVLAVLISTNVKLVESDQVACSATPAAWNHLVSKGLAQVVVSVGVAPYNLLEVDINILPANPLYQCWLRFLDYKKAFYPGYQQQCNAACQAHEGLWNGNCGLLIAIYIAPTSCRNWQAPAYQSLLSLNLDLLDLLAINVNILTDFLAGNIIQVNFLSDNSILALNSLPATGLLSAILGLGGSDQLCYQDYCTWYQSTKAQYIQWATNNCHSLCVCYNAGCNTSYCAVYNPALIGLCVNPQGINVQLLGCLVQAKIL